MLVCDDTESIRRLLRILLELEGHAVEEAADAQALMDTLRATDHPVPDLLLLDAHMAPRDGWWAIGEIRSDPRLSALRVILVTAAVHGLDDVLVEEAGFDAFLGKPFDPDELIGVVSRTLAGNRATADPS